MCQQNKKNVIRRYNVSGSRTVANYCWSTLSLIGGFSFFLTGLYSYISNFLLQSEKLSKWSFFNNLFWLFSFIQKNIYSLDSTKVDFDGNLKILFFPQGLSMCFYGLVGILVGAYLWFCISFGVGCGFTEFNKEKGFIRIFRLGFPGKNRFINYKYSIDNIQSLFVSISSNIVPTSQRGIYMRIKNVDNQVRDIPLELYSEKTSLETIESQAADLSKFLRVSLSIN